MLTTISTVGIIEIGIYILIMWDKIQDFFSNSHDEIRESNLFSYLINSEHIIRTIAFALIGLFIVWNLIQSILNGSLFLFFGMAVFTIWVYSKVFPHR